MTEIDMNASMAHILIIFSRAASEWIAWIQMHAHGNEKKSNNERCLINTTNTIVSLPQNHFVGVGKLTGKWNIHNWFL